MADHPPDDDEDCWDTFRRQARENPPEPEKPLPSPTQPVVDIWEATAGPFRKNYLPASHFAGIADPGDRAYEMYGAYRRDQLDLFDPAIRELIAGLGETFHGALLDELVHPKPREVRPKPRRRRKQPKFKRPIRIYPLADYFVDED